jgi:Dolichyl-phosphate-mannose-protein mannosyltransferase
MTQHIEIPIEDVPRWMQQAQRGWDWGVLLVIAICVIAAWPFILQPGLPRTNASENYVFMASDFSDALREGRLYPRWSPHALNGYGAPIPNYYPPLPAYSAAVVTILITNDVVLSVRIVYILAFCLTGTSLYLFVNRRINAAAGFLSVILLVYSPYFGQVAPHIQGDLSGVVAMALLTMLLWLVDRLLTINRPLDTLLTAIVSSGLFLTEPRIALVGIGLVILLISYHLWLRGRHTHWLPVIISLAAGVGMAAFYWLPALVEYEYVQWRPRLYTTPIRLTLEAMISPLRPVDLAELAPAPQLTIGVVGMVFAIFSVFTALILRKSMAFSMLFLVVGFILIGLGVTIFPTQTWLLGPIMMCIAVGGSGVMAIRFRLPLRWQRLSLVALMIVVLAASSPIWLAPRWTESFGDASPLQQILYDQEGGAAAVLPLDMPVPATIPESLAPNRSLISGYQSGSMNRIAFQPSSSLEISVLHQWTHDYVFQIRSNGAAHLEILTAYFPGWQAFLDNQPISLGRNERTGLMSVDIPGGNSQLHVTLGPTPVRQNAWLLSALALVSALFMTWLRIRQHVDNWDLPDLLSLQEVRLVDVTLACFTIVIGLFAASFSPFSFHARPGYALDNAISLRSRTESGLEAVAYRLNQPVFRPGDTLDLTLYWQAVRFLPANYQTQVYLLDANQEIRWHRTDFRAPGGYPTRRWLTYRYISDNYQIALSDSIIPGDYQIAVEVYACDVTCDPGQRLTFFDVQGHNRGQVLLLPAKITITH